MSKNTGAVVKGDKKVMNAWAFYDWANSVYPLVITTAIFPIFYGAKMPEIIELFGGTFSKIGIYSYTIAISLLLVAILSPVLSGIADFAGNKKSFMKLFNYIGALSCMSLYFFENLPVHFQFLVIFTANLGFWGSLVFYNSYLPEIAERKDHDKLSAKGFSLGYIGSVILLVISLVLVIGAEADQKFLMMRYTFLVTGLWWIGFAQVSYYFLPDSPKQEKINLHILSSGYKELKSVWREFMTIKSLKRYLRAFFVYSMAVQTIMTMAQFFGLNAVDWSVGLDIDFSNVSNAITGDNLIILKNKNPIVAERMQVSMITSIILIQLIAIPGAFLFSYLAQFWGNIKVLMIAVSMWIIICCTAYFINTPMEFYTLAFFVGLIQGGIQSLSRSTYSKMIPDTTDTTSYFSFFDVLEKIGMTIGIISFGFLENAFSIRYSVMALAFFFVIGLILLFFVPREHQKSQKNIV